MSAPGMVEFGGPESGPASRPAARRYPRAGAAVLVGLLILAAGCAAPGGTSKLVEPFELPSSDNHQHLVADDAVYSLLTFRGEVSAHDLPGGAPRWTASIADLLVDEEDSSLLRLHPVGGRVLVTGERTTVALDAGTGRILWSVPWPIESVTSEVALAGFAHEGEPTDEGGQGETETLVAIDLDTGTELWSSPRLRYWRTVPRTEIVLAYTLDRAVEALHPHTAQVRQRWTSEPDVPLLSPIVGPGLFAIQRGSELTGYDAGTLQQRWQLSTPDDSPVSDLCGVPFCFYDGPRLGFIDPVTGEVTATELEHALPVGWFGHVLVRDQYGTVGIVDPDMARIRIDLTDWPMLTPDDQWSLPLAIRFPGRNTSRIALVEPDATELRHDWSVPYAVSRCFASGSHVACQTDAQRLRVWRYR